MLAEIEAVLNSRPLSYVDSESTEPQPLTPSHFLVGKRLTSLPPKTDSTLSGDQREQRGHGPAVEIPAETLNQLLE